MSHLEALLTRWLLHVLVVGNLLLLLVWLLMKYVREPARRQRIGEWGLVAVLFLPLLCLAPGWIVLVLPASISAEPLEEAGLAPEVTTAPHAQEPTVEPRSSVDEVVPDWALTSFSDPSPLPTVPSNPPHGDGEQSATAPNVNWSGWMRGGLLLLWVTGAGVFLGQFLLGLWGLRRQVRRARPAPRAARRLFRALARHIPRARLLISDQVRVPHSFGLWRPTVMVPRRLCQAGSERFLHWILAHEVAHLQRRDAWASVLLGLAKPLFYVAPWFWSLQRQLRLCQEYLADAATVAVCGIPSEDYAEFLLLCSSRTPVPSGALGIFDHKSDLFRRINMLVQNRSTLELACPRRWSLLIGAGLLSFAVILAGVTLHAHATPAPTSDRVAADSPREQPKKDEPKKETPRKDSDTLPGLPDIEKMLERFPNLPPDQAKMLRKQLEDTRKMLEQMQKDLPAFPGIGGIGGAGGFWQGPVLPRGLARLGRNMEPRLGVMVEKPSETIIEQLALPKNQGLVIDTVRPNSAASKAGLKAHDILLEVQGKAVPSNVEEFTRVLKDIKADTAFDIVVLRKNKKETIKGVKLPEVNAGNRRPGGILRGLGGATSLSISRSGDNFKAKEQSRGVTLEVEGQVVQGTPQVGKVTVTDAKGTNTYESLDKVPESYRDRALKLAEMAGGTGQRVPPREDQ